MVGFATEMERQGFDIPLLIGGATTSKAHTAVKVVPRYHGPVIWVKDASRSVPVAAALLSDTQRPGLLAGVTADYDALRERHAAKQGQRAAVTVEEARANRSPVDWTDHRPLRPRMLVQQDHDVHQDPSYTQRRTALMHPVRVFRDYPVEELRRYVDWQPFFNAWEMKGRFPDILNNPASGEAARRLWDDAQRMLDTIVRERWLSPSGVIGFFPANAVGDDVHVFGDERRTEPVAVLHHLRQQGRHREGVPNRSLSDYVAPLESGVADWVGGFAVTAGLGTPDRVAAFKAELDDYSAILLESLADRLAEAFAERLHERVRRQHWGYDPDERMDNAALIKETYNGIRPAPGYPACPDHTEKQTLWQLLDVEANTGITLTESMAMWPGAAVSGWYFSHPQSQYFVVGRIGRDQVVDYAARKGWTVEEAERWLSPNLGY